MNQLSDLLSFPHHY